MIRAPGSRTSSSARQPSGVAGALDHDPVGDARARAQPSGRESQRAADLGVGEVDGAAGVEAVVEEEVGGHAQVARPQAGQPRARQRKTGELGHAQVGDVRERALPQLDGHADARAGQPQRARDRRRAATAARARPAVRTR